MNTQLSRATILASAAACLALVSSACLAQDNKGKQQQRPRQRQQQPQRQQPQRQQPQRQQQQQRAQQPQRAQTALPGGSWRNGNGNDDGGRPNAFNGGQRFKPADWRQSHPDWNGHLYYRNETYYYDDQYAYPAQLDNEWVSIAALSGGVALLGQLTDDPYLVFAGDAGALYSLSQYQIDLDSQDPQFRLRAEFFARPFFWRDGVRYDRHMVEQGGGRYYQLQRH